MIRAIDDNTKKILPGRVDNHDTEYCVHVEQKRKWKNLGYCGHHYLYTDTQDNTKYKWNKIEFVARSYRTARSMINGVSHLPFCPICGYGKEFIDKGLLSYAPWSLTNQNSQGYCIECYHVFPTKFTN